MQCARLGNIQVPHHFAGPRIELDQPTAGRTWGLVERLHSSPQDAAHKLERIDPSKMGDLAEELAIQVELLNSAVFPVCDIDCSFLVDLDRMGQVELARTGAGLAPLPHSLAIGGVFQNPSVAVAIGDQEMSVGPEGDVSGSVERHAGLRLLAHRDGHELFAKRRIFDDD